MNEKLNEKINSFNPSENGLRDSGIFGLPFSEEESKLILLPVPWEATVSYQNGTAAGPEAILKASQQIDLNDPLYPTGWQKGITMLEISKNLIQKNKKTSRKVRKFLKFYFKNKVRKNLQESIKKDCLEIKNYIKKNSLDYLNKNKIVGLIGGEHSIPLGYLEALGEKHETFGILQIDAHCDLRPAYEGLEYSHASIFNNALKISNVSKLIQIGIRDFSPIEAEILEKEKERISIYLDNDIKRRIFLGESLDKIYTEIIEKLPEKIYLSFDIDGLKPELCPNTGTPVPGGFSIEEINFLFEKIIASGKKVIGFDLSEVAPGKEGEWDANVGSRILYKLCLLSLKTNT
jgi:agmatinase